MNALCWIETIEGKEFRKSVPDMRGVVYARANDNAATECTRYWWELKAKMEPLEGCDIWGFSASLADAQAMADLSAAMLLFRTRNGE